jgi:hypothetical protein
MAYCEAGAVYEMEWDDDTVFCKTFAILEKSVLPTRTQTRLNTRGKTTVFWDVTPYSLVDSNRTL